MANVGFLSIDFMASEKFWTMGRLHIATSVVKSWLVIGIYDFSPLLAALICGEQVFTQPPRIMAKRLLHSFRCAAVHFWGVMMGLRRIFTKQNTKNKPTNKQNIVPPRIAVSLCLFSPMFIRL